MENNDEKSKNIENLEEKDDEKERVAHELELKRINEGIKRDKENREKLLEKAYEVGYKRPPVSGQFKKGTSGNPKGRKKKPLPSSFEEALRQAFYKEVSITNSNGTKEKTPLLTVFAQKVVQDAISKDGQSRKFLLQDQRFRTFNFLDMVERVALEDFEPEISEEERNWARNAYIEKLDKYYLEHADDI